MISNNTNIGRYVEKRVGPAGMPRYFWCVPEEIRPEGWAAAVALPTKRSGRLKNKPGTIEEEVRLDAKRLNAHLDLALAYDEEGSTLAHVAQGWMKSDRWDEMSYDRKKSSPHHINHILRWSAEMGHPDVNKIRLSQVEAFLKQYKDRRSLRLQLRSALNILFERAVDDRLIPRSPITSLVWTAPIAHTSVWQQEDVDLFIEAARRQGKVGLVGLMTTMWRTCQRPGDVRGFRRGIEYRNHHFLFNQSKTNRRMSIAATADVRDMIEAARTESEYLFTSVTGRPFTRDTLWREFAEVRKEVDADGPRLQIRALRHSCVMRLARAGANILQIAGLTGHKVGTVQSMIEHYFSADDQLTRQALILDMTGNGEDITSLPDSIPRFSEVANDNDWTTDRVPVGPRNRRA